MDSMDRARNGADWLPKLTRAYGHAATLKYARDNGYEVVTDEEEQDGTRRNEALGITTLLLPARPELAATSSTVLRGLGSYPGRDE
jgi:Protein of unknown function (DUF1257)